MNDDPFKHARITHQGFAEGLWEVCPHCQGEVNGCTHCWDSGLVIHRCRDDDPPAENESEHA